MLHRICLLVLSALALGCATAKPKAGFRTGPGPVGVVFQPPDGFTHSSNYDLNDDLFFGPPGSFQILRVTDLPLPFDVEALHNLGRGDQIDQTTVDAWAARYTRDPSVALVSAHSLFWDPDKLIGAVEVSYKNAEKKALEFESKNTARVAIIITRRGVCTVSLTCIAGFGKSAEKAWLDLLNGISVGHDARPAKSNS